MFDSVRRMVAVSNVVKHRFVGDTVLSDELPFIRLLQQLKYKKDNNYKNNKWGLLCDYHKNTGNNVFCRLCVVGVCVD